MTRTLFFIAVLVRATAVLVAQTPDASESFEVASVKPGDPSFQGMSMRTAPNRFAVTNATLQFLIGYAWRVQNFQIYGLPGWAKSELFSIDARIPDIPRVEKTSAEQIPAMLRHLLEGRFSLRLHKETRELPAYALVVAQSGAKLTPDAAGPGGITSGPGMLRLAGQPLSELAENLARQIGRPVLDRTGISGAFDMALKWAPDATSADATGPSVFTAIQEQLGLKLQPVKAPVEVLVIERVERPSAN